LIQKRKKKQEVPYFFLTRVAFWFELCMYIGISESFKG
jgi:hypothetical protein